jgi:hypothetical protein
MFVSFSDAESCLISTLLAWKEPMVLVFGDEIPLPEMIHSRPSFSVVWEDPLSNVLKILLRSLVGGIWVAP